MNFKQNLPSFIEVGVPFIQDAHRVACSEWKRKIEDAFPYLFTSREVELIEEIKECPEYKTLAQYLTDATEIKITSINGSILVNIPLPNTNKTWSLRAFNLIHRLINTYEIKFIEHKSKSVAITLTF